MTIAHAGHWFHSLLYLAPVLLISAALWWSGRDEERPPAEEAQPQEPAREPGEPGGEAPDG